MKTLLLALTLVTFSSLYGEVAVLAGSPNYLQNLALAGPNGNIQFAVSPNGKAIVVWTNWPNQGAELQAAFFDGDSWQYLNNTALPVDFEIISPLRNFFFRNVNNSGTFAIGSSPRVGIDSVGNATIVWVSPNSQIIAARYNGPNLTAPPNQSGVTQLTEIGTSNISPTLVVSQEGVTVVVWIRAASYQVQARSFNPIPGATWGPQVIFMPILTPSINIDAVNSIQCTNIPANSNGTYPAGLGLNNANPSTGLVQGNMVWIDGPTGAVRAGNFVVPFQDTRRSTKVSCGVLGDDHQGQGVDGIPLDRDLSVHN